MTLKEEFESEILICNNDGFTLFKLNNKQLGVVFGTLAYLFLLQSAPIILINPIQAISGIIIAFFICLPVSYLQMEKHRLLQKIKGVQ